MVETLEEEKKEKSTFVGLKSSAGKTERQRGRVQGKCRINGNRKNVCLTKGIKHATAEALGEHSTPNFATTSLSKEYRKFWGCKERGSILVSHPEDPC